jgi:hypothetical protein
LLHLHVHREELLVLLLHHLEGHRDCQTLHDRLCYHLDLLTLRSATFALMDSAQVICSIGKSERIRIP